MTGTHRKRIHPTFIRSGTVCGRLGIMADGGHLPPVLLERLKISGRPKGTDKAEDEGEGVSLAKADLPLSEIQKMHVMAILGKTGECTGAELEEFRNMHPGVRELRIRNRVSSIWTLGEWKSRLEGMMKSGERLPGGFERADLIAEEIAAARNQMGNLCFALSLRDATADERKEALLKEGAATEFQSSFFPKATPEALAEFVERLDGAGTGGLRHFWRSGKHNLLSAASAAHKARFTNAPFSNDERSLLKAVLQDDNPGKSDLQMFAYAFSNDISRFESMIEAIRSCTWQSAEPLLEAAQSSSEFDTLLYFLGRRDELVYASISKNPGFTRAHSPNHMQADDNGDALTSIAISVIGPEGERRISLDAVFDGVSGQGGASMASRMAKDVLEVASLAGWIRGPEDVRQIAVLADLVIDLNKDGLKHTDMGTTMAATYIEGDKFFGIHCGDSDWKVIRGDAVVFASVPHGIGNRIWSGLGIGPRELHVNNRGSMKYAPFILMDGDVSIDQTDGTGDVVCDHELCIAVADNPANPAGMRDEIVSIADLRKDPLQKYETLCGCEPLDGKDDDMAVIARDIRLGN